MFKKRIHIQKMYQPTASEVNKLRKETGAGIMDCKKSLAEALGDFQKAIEILRKKGQKIALNRSDRQANEGVLALHLSDDKKKGVIMSLNCETDFVSKNAGFIKLAHDIVQKSIHCNNLDELLESSLEGNSNVREKLTEQTGIIGEKIYIKSFEILEAEFVSGYIHHNNKLGALVGLSRELEGADQLAKEIGMQVVAMNPLSLNEKSLPSAIIEKELEIYKEQLQKEGKPEKVIEQIAQGKLKKFFSENTLLHQSFIKDQALSVGQYMENFNPEVKIEKFKRISV